MDTPAKRFLWSMFFFLVGAGNGMLVMHLLQNR